MAQNTASAAATAMGARRSAVPVESVSANSLPPALELEPRIVAEQPVYKDVLPADASDVIESMSVEGNDKIYSRSDASVTPPRQIYPALPAARPAEFPRHLTVT